MVTPLFIISLNPLLIGSWFPTLCNDVGSAIKGWESQSPISRVLLSNMIQYINIHYLPLESLNPLLTGSYFPTVGEKVWIRHAPLASQSPISRVLLSNILDSTSNNNDGTKSQSPISRVLVF